ncbi:MULTISPECIES: hypothetical protein [unclassified Agarivorans]|uniref:hypothetical protein n=1 Tax=unclassified Agarivorans TaxID=2636026 RepID=UPI003D7E54C4
MKGIISGVLLALALSGCAMTRPSVEEVADSYHSELNTPQKETIRETLSEHCSSLVYKDNVVKVNCYLSGDVLVYNANLINRRWEWTPQAAAANTKNILKNICEQDVLQYGFAVLVNLEGENGFVGKLKTYDDCLNL